MSSADPGTLWPVIPQSDSGQLELRDYLAVLQRRKLTILLITLVVVVSSVGVSLLETPVYRATSQVLLQARSSEELFAPQGVVAAPRVETEIEVMKSGSVRQAVAEELGFGPAVEIAAVGDTQVLTISAESTAPAEAALIANRYAEIYIDTRREQLIDDLLTASQEVQLRADDIDAQIAVLDQPLADIDAQIAAAEASSDRIRLQEDRARLEDDLASQRASLEARRSSYAEQLDRLQLASNLTQTGGAQLVSRATVPSVPVRPTPLRNGMLAVVVGSMLGMGVAFLREYLDDTVKNNDDLKRATGGLNALALIPVVAGWKDRATPQVVSITDPTSPAAEAYRSLRTSVQFIGLDHPVQVLQLTSPNASEGKTTTLANLGVALANTGQRVIVVCCDLRRPRIHEFFGLTNETGFTSVLLGKCPLSAALQPVPGQDRLSLMASGPTPPNPSELLASRRTAEVLSALRSECDVVLVDSPPVLPVTDSIVLSRMVDATILVGTAGRTTRKEYRRAVELLQQVDAPLVGSVLNGVEQEGLYGYGYGYGYYQTDDGVAVTANGSRNGATNGAGAEEAREAVRENARPGKGRRGGLRKS